MLKLLSQSQRKQGWVADKKLIKCCDSLACEVVSYLFIFLNTHCAKKIYPLLTGHNKSTFAVEADKRLLGCIGRPKSNLFMLIKNDLNQRNLKINSIAELNDVRDIARCRERWKNLF